MALSLQPLPDFDTPGSPTDHIYIFAADQQPAGGPWVGAFAYASNAHPTMHAMSLSDFFSGNPAQRNPGVLSNPKLFQHAGFLFLQKPPDPSKGPDFRASLLAAAQSFPAWGSGVTLGGFVLWLDAFGAFDLTSKPALIFPGKNHGDGTCEYDLQVKPYRLFDAGGTARTVFFDAGSLGAGTVLGVAGDALTLRLDGRANLSFGDSAPKRPAVALSTVTIPMSGPTAGCFAFTGTNAGALTDFELGFQYAISLDGANPTRLACSLLDTAETLAGAAVSGALDTVGSTGPVRNTLQIAPAGGRFMSAYRTVWDETIALAPASGVQFTGAASPDANLPSRLYFVPNGDFAMTGPAIPNATGSDHQLLCGFTAVETISFTDGDLLRFTASGNASIAVTSVGASSYAFSVSAPGSFGTAWAMVVGASKSTNRYRSESERSPFFSPAGQSPLVLTHDGFVMGQLRPPQSQDKGYPLLPYTAVMPTDGFPMQAGAIGAFEAGYVSPTRGALVRILLQPATPIPLPKPPNTIQQPGMPATVATVALTPQGYVVGFDKNNAIVAIELGSAADSTLLFAEKDAQGKLTGNPLSSDLVDAFLAPQQFIVASAATDNFKKYITVTLGMSGWNFDFAPDSSPGDYKSVLVIKSAPGRTITSTTGDPNDDTIVGNVTSLAASPSAWTGYNLFNDTSLDPSGQVLSSWITTYIADAQALWNKGLGLAGLSTFCELVNDADWDGFLFLRVPVDPHEIDPQLSFLLAGCDTSQLVAHHIGCAVNHVEYGPTPGKPATYSYAQDSSFFGLVHYLKPGTTPGSIQATAYVPSSVPYDFQLLALEAVFENSALQTFSSSALVVLNSLFGDAVLGSHDSGGPTATNTLLIQGALQHSGGTPTYVFSTAPGATSTFYLSSGALDHVEIDRAVVVQNGEVNQRSTVTFQMAGWMATLAPTASAATPFDLLSYASLSFVNFGLAMSYGSNDSPSPGSNKQFAPDLSNFAITPLADKQFDGTLVDTASAMANTLYRANSLVASFPMTLKGFIIGAVSQTPAGMGYRALSTNPSTNGNDPSGEWYGFAFDLPLGGSGSLDAAGLINANLMFTWNAGGAGTPAFAPFIKLTGPGGTNLSFDLEGILKFGADGIYLSQAGTGANAVYQLTFASIGVTLFTKTFPPKGSTNITIAGFGDRSLGWFGAYADPNAPNMTSPPAVASRR